MSNACTAPLPNPARPRVALMVDGDNISHEQAGRIILQAAKHGDTLNRRVYGNAALRPGWLAAPGLHFRHAGCGKNAADLLLTVEAMDLMLTGRADVLVIASSDRDFAHLATHLRERGQVVVGIGEKLANEAFRKSGTKFVELPPLGAPPPQAASIEAQVVALIRAAPNGNLKIAALSLQMRKDHDVRISEQPQKTWRAWLLARPHLFVCDPKGPEASVRLTAAAPA